MIKTTPHYIPADGLSFKSYFSHFFASHRLEYASVWNWWKQTTLYHGALLLLTCLLMLAAIVWQEMQSAEPTDWALVLSCSIMPLLIFMPLIWALTYVQSIMMPRNITRQLRTFVEQYMRINGDVICVTLSNYIVSHSDLTLEVGYTLVPEMNANGKVKRNHACFFAAVYYIPSPEEEEKWFDEMGQIRDSNRQEWEAYCENKESCQRLFLREYAIIALFKKSELKDAKQVNATMEQVKYLMGKFGLLPLRLVNDDAKAQKKAEENQSNASEEKQSSNESEKNLHSNESKENQRSNESEEMKETKVRPE